MLDFRQSDRSTVLTFAHRSLRLRVVSLNLLDLSFARPRQVFSMQLKVKFVDQNDPNHLSRITGTGHT